MPSTSLEGPIPPLELILLQCKQSKHLDGLLTHSLLRGFTLAATTIPGLILRDCFLKYSQLVLNPE